MASGGSSPAICKSRCPATSRSRRAIPRRCVNRCKPGDVLLVEGNNHIAGVIKYLTQSTWSHSALYVGPIDGRVDRGRRAARADRGQCRRRRGFGAAVEIFSLPHPHLPPGRPDRGRLRDGVRLRRRAHRLRLRSQEYHRPDALSVSAAGAAALAAAPDRARLGRSVAAHLLGADRGRVSAPCTIRSCPRSR